MSYLSHAQDPRRRATAIAGVTVIHAAIGLGLVVGLTVYGFKPLEPEYDPPVTFTPKPEAKPPERRPEVEPQVSRPVAPLPPIPIPRPENQDVDLFDEADVVIPEVSTRADQGPTVQPQRPAPSFTPRGARPSNNPQSWLSNDDYPFGTEAEGIAAYRLIVATNGRVAACDVTRSTGSRQLDNATCRLIERRARFEAATDETGAKVVGSYTGSVKWEIPD